MNDDVMQIGRRGLLTATAALAVIRSGLAATAAAPHLPHVAAEDLDRRTVRFPEDLTAGRTILLIAFKRGQQEEVESWVRGLGLGEAGPPWFEMPVIDDPGFLGRWFIAEGMRGGVPDTATRRHVAVVYTDANAFRMSLGIASAESVTAAVVDRTGRVIVAEQGPFTPASGAVIARATAGE